MSALEKASKADFFFYSYVHIETQCVFQMFVSVPVKQLFCVETFLLENLFSPKIVCTCFCVSSPLCACEVI